MISTKLKSRLDKIHALAVRGISGERDAAKNRLLVVLAKHGLTMEDYLPGSTKKAKVKVKIPKPKSKPKAPEPNVWVRYEDIFDAFRIFLDELDGHKKVKDDLYTYFHHCPFRREDFGDKQAYFLDITPEQFRSKQYTQLRILAMFSEWQVSDGYSVRFRFDVTHIRFTKRK